MEGYALYYPFVNIVCALIFGVLLFFNRHNIDRQEKQIRFDRVLIAFMLYFITDSFWSMIIAGKLPKTRFNIVVIVLLMIFMGSIIYFWLEYVLVMEHVPGWEEPRKRFLFLLPFLVATVALILNCIIAPQALFTETYDIKPLYSVYLITVPVIYLIIILFYTLRRTKSTDSPLEKGDHLAVGLLPFATLIVALSQAIFFSELPLFCSASVILMLLFYIRSINNQVSVDPLTGLNNRGQLTRYTSQTSNLYMDDRQTIVIMMDIDRFKMINDTYGHAEGDKALVIVSSALKKVISNYKMPAFIGRYGGDEFILIIHPDNGDDPAALIKKFRSDIADRLQEEDVPFELAISLGYESLSENETFHDCLLQADKNLYADKKYHR